VLDERGNVAGLKFGSVHTPHIDNWTTAEEWMGGGQQGSTQPITNHPAPQV